MNSKLNLNWNLVDEARESAKKIAADAQVFVDAHSTVTVERTICRLLGIDGIDEFEVPLPNVVVDFIKENGNISLGVAKYLGNAMLETGLQPQEIAERIARKELDVTKMKWHDDFEIKLALKGIAEANVERIKSNRAKREEYLNVYGDKKVLTFM